MVLICISLMASDEEHVLMYLLAMSMSSTEISVPVLRPFHDWIVCFFAAEFNKIFIDLGYFYLIGLLSDRSFANIFSHSVGCLLVLLTVSFAVQKLFILSPNSSFLLLFPLPS